MGGETKLSGPDFAAGIPESEVPADGPLLGQANGESVLLVRNGEEIFAVGATCTHYGGPLAEGRVVDGTIRCPWHHACFDLRTGSVLRAPAMNPLPCYDVERADGKIRVAGRRGDPITLRRESSLRTIAIVGAGAAGESAAETLRREGYDGEILLFGADEAPPVDRPNLSKDYLAGTAPEEWMPLRPPSFFGEKKIALTLGARVTAVDPAAKRLALEDGREVAWDALLLATGAAPIRPPLPGADLPHVHTLRTLGDSRGIIAGASNAKRAVVIGASFIAMEVAASLRARDLTVEVVAPEEVPFSKSLGPELGKLLRSVHEEHGVRFHLGTTAARIEANGVVLANGERLGADLVVLGVGVKPAIELAQAAGLTVDRGVVVDDRLRTSAPGVYAAGDIARFPYAPTGEPVRIEHWAVAQRMGRVAALNMLGRDLAFTSPPFFWTTQFDVTINYVGHAENWDRIDISGDLDKRDATIAYRRGAETLAVATVGRDLVSLDAETAFERNDQATLGTFGRTR
ncbi:MAG TPA: FAD-dependent oxidoreductase [Polyangia bacterium]|jgi:NADPH-dependent 2,4-dienoyl-CoA reductase/sulfur reductase-like enzyme/nitrite reductase/ring-hydroxylating ferredoxin subunit